MLEVITTTEFTPMSAIVVNVKLLLLLFAAFVLTTVLFTESGVLLKVKLLAAVGN
jgi:hypothetical protein